MEVEKNGERDRMDVKIWVEGCFNWNSLIFFSVLKKSVHPNLLKNKFEDLTPLEEEKEGMAIL